MRVYQFKYDELLVHVYTGADPLDAAVRHIQNMLRIPDSRVEDWVIDGAWGKVMAAKIVDISETAEGRLILRMK